METLRSIANIPRLILNDFKIVGFSVLDFCASFARGYIAFFFEIVHDIKVTFAPYFDPTLYRSILHDFVVVLRSITEPIRSFIKSIFASISGILSSTAELSSTSMKRVTLTQSSARTPAKRTAIETNNYGPVRAFFIKYRTLLADIYDEVTIAMEETDEIPAYLIAASILVFILGCVWFYIIMVFLV